MTDTLPKQELLLKLLNMTTVREDTMAVVAIRKANELLASSGWTWEKLLAGKITVVADPFASINTPPAAPNGPSPWQQPVPPSRPAPSPPPRPQPQPTAARTTPPPPRPAPRPKFPVSDKSNAYGNNCWNCGDRVDVRAGWIIQPDKHGGYGSGSNKWQVLCTPCNNTGNVHGVRAPFKKQPAPITSPNSSVGLDSL